MRKGFVVNPSAGLLHAGLVGLLSAGSVVSGHLFTIWQPLDLFSVRPVKVGSTPSQPGWAKLSSCRPASAVASVGIVRLGLGHHLSHIDFFPYLLFKSPLTKGCCNLQPKPLIAFGPTGIVCIDFVQHKLQCIRQPALKVLVFLVYIRQSIKRQYQDLCWFGTVGARRSILLFRFCMLYQQKCLST